MLSMRSATPGFTVLASVLLSTLAALAVVSLVAVDSPPAADREAEFEALTLVAQPEFAEPAGAGAASRCAFDYDRDWDALPVPKCAEQGEAGSFVMLFTGESGSTAIQAGIMQHSRVYQMDESKPPSFKEMELIDEWQVKGVDAKVERMHGYFANATKAGKIPGFKFRAQAAPAVMQLDPKYRPRFLWNYRRNIFSQAFGLLRKHSLGKSGGGLTDETWEEACEKTNTCTYTIDIRALKKQLARSLYLNDQLTNTLHALGAECILPVPYEELDECPDRLFAHIYKFLGLPYERHTSGYSKNSAPAMCDEIENWDEVCDAFIHCPSLRWQLDPHLNCKCTNLKSANLANASLCPVGPLAV